MADYIINIENLESKCVDLNGLNSTISQAYKSFSSSNLNMLSTTEIAFLGNRISGTIKRLKNGHNNSYSWLNKYLEELTTLEANLTKSENDELVEFNGTFEDIFGKVTIPSLKTGADESANAAKFFAGLSGDGTVLVDILNNEYIVADTPGELIDYYNNVIRGKGLYQDANYSIYRDQCLGFAYNYAWGLYTNNRDIDGSQCRNNTSCSSNFTNYTTNDEGAFLSKLYEEISAGRPVVIQVIGSRSRRSRHYVTAVGFRNGIKSANELKTTDLLIVDSYDGNIKEVVPYGASSGRYVAKGTQINGSRYNYGYEMYYIDT